MPCLGVTRAMSHMEELKKLTDAKGVELIDLPFLEYNYLEFEWPSDVKENNPDWIFFTSANGVHSFFVHLEKININLTNIKFAVIGNNTKTALENHNYKADFIPEKSYGRNLFEEAVRNLIKENQTVIYVQAEKVNYNPTQLLSDNNIKYYPIISYRTIIKKIEKDKTSKLTDNDAILFTASSTVNAYQNQFGIPLARAIAIGEVTASTMAELNWPDFITMESPDLNKVLEYIK